MTVRSRRLFLPLRVAVGGVFTPLYTVPTGRTARASLFTLSNISVGNIFVVVAQVVPGGVRSIWDGPIVAQTTREVLQGWIGNPDDQLQVYCDASGSLDICGYGSLLLGAPG